MRRTRLKILPSRCVATLGFTLLLLACPTIAEEIVRPTGFGDTEPSASHIHARIKNVPPELIGICNKGDPFPGATVSPLHRENTKNLPTLSDHQCQAIEDQTTPTAENASKKNRGNAEASVCDTSGGGSLAGSVNLWRSSTERRIYVGRRNRVAAEDSRKRRNNPLSVTPIGMRSRSLCSECDLQRRQPQRKQDESREARRINDISKPGKANSVGNKYSGDREDLRRARRLAEMNDRITLRRDYLSDRRMRGASRGMTTTETLILRETPDVRVKSDARGSTHRSEGYAVESLRVDSSLRREITPVLTTSRQNERVNGKRVTAVGVKDSRRGIDREGPRNNRRSSDLRNARIMQQSRYSRIDSATITDEPKAKVDKTALERRKRSVTRLDKLLEGRKSALDRESSTSERSARITGSIPEVRSNIHDSFRKSLSEDSRRVNTRYARGELSATSDMRRVASVPQIGALRIQDEGRAIINSGRASDVFENARLNIRKIPKFLQQRRTDVLLEERRHPESKSRTETIDMRNQRTRHLKGARRSADEKMMRTLALPFERYDDRRDTSGKPESLISTGRTRRTALIDQRSGRGSSFIASDSTSAGRITRRTRSIPDIRSIIPGASRRSVSLDSRMTNSRFVQEDTHQPLNSGRESGFDRIDVLRSRGYERTFLKRSNTITVSRDQKMNIRTISPPMQRREHAHASRRTSNLPIVRSQRDLPEKNNDQSGTLRRSESIGLERRVRSTSRIDHLSELRSPSIASGTLSVDRVARRRSVPETRFNNRETSRRSLSTDALRVNEKLDESDTLRRSESFESDRRVRSTSRIDHLSKLRSPSIASGSLRVDRVARRRSEPETLSNNRDASRRSLSADSRRKNDRLDESDTLRRSDSFGSDRRVRSTSRIDHLSGPRSPSIASGTLSVDREARRRSLPETRSNIRGASRRSLSVVSQRVKAILVPEGLGQNSRLHSFRSLSAGTESREKIRDNDDSRILGISIRTSSLPLQRRERDLGRVSRRLKELQMTRAVKDASGIYDYRRHSLRSSETLGADRRVRSISRIDYESDGRSPLVVRDSTSVDRATRRARSITNVQSNIHDDSRRSLSADSRRSFSSFVQEDTRQVPRALRNTRFNRIDISRSRGDERTSLVRSETVAVSREPLMTARIPSPLQRRERGSAQGFRKSSELVRALRVVSDRYSDQRDTLRRFETLESERREGRTSRIDQLSEHHLPRLARDSITAERTIRRTRSTPNSQSSIHDSSRLSISADRRRANTRIVREDTNQALNFRRDSRFNRIDISGTRVGERMAHERGNTISVSGDQEMNIRAISPKKQEQELAQESRGSSELQIVRTKRDVSERYFDRGNYIRRSEFLVSKRRVPGASSIDRLSGQRLSVVGSVSKIAENSGRRDYSLSRVRLGMRESSIRRSEVIAERKIRRTSSLDQLHERHSPVTQRDLSAREGTARRLRSISSDRSDIRDSYSRAFVYPGDLRRTQARSTAGKTYESSSVWRDYRLNRLNAIGVSQAKDVVMTSAVRRPEIDVSRDHRMDMRVNYLSPQRSERTSPLSSKRFPGDHRTRTVWAALESNSGGRDTLRRSTLLSSERMKSSSPRIGHLIERQLPDSVYESSSADRASTSPMSSLSVSSEVLDDSRRSFLHSGNSRRTDVRSMAKELYRSQNLKRDDRFAKDETSGSRRGERASYRRSTATDASKNQQLHIRLDSLQLQQRERNSGWIDTGSVEERTVRTMQFAIERSSEPSNTMRRSESLVSNRKVVVASRNHRQSERRSRSISSGSSTLDRDVRQRKFVRSDRLEIHTSRRSLSADSRGTITQFARGDVHDTLAAGRDTRFVGIDVSRSRGEERTSIERSKTIRISRSQSVNIRARSPPQERLERDSELASRRSSDIQLERTERNAERYSDRRNTLRRSESITSERITRSASRIYQQSERRSQSITSGTLSAEAAAGRIYVPETRSNVRDSSRQSLAEDSRGVNARFSQGDVSLASGVRRDARLDIYRSRSNERTLHARSINIAVSRGHPMNIRARFLPLQRQERGSGRELRRHYELQMVRNMQVVPGRDTFRRFELLESEGRVENTARIDQVSERRLPRLARDSAVAERTTRRTRSVFNARNDIGGIYRRSDPYSLESRQIFSRSLALEIAGSPSMRRGIRLSTSRDIGRTPLQKTSPSEFSRSLHLNIRTTTPVPQQQEPDLAPQTYKRLAKHQLVRRTIDRNSDQIDILRGSARWDNRARLGSSGADRRVRSASRIDQIFGRRFPTLGHEFTAAKRLERRFQSASSDRFDARRLIRSALGGDMKPVLAIDSFTQESRKSARDSFSDGIIRTISRFERASERGVTLKIHDMMTAVLLNRQASLLAGANSERQLSSRRSELKSAASYRTYSSYTTQKRRQASSSTTARHDMQELMFRASRMQTGVNESGNKVAGTRFSFPSSSAMVQRLAPEARQEKRISSVLAPYMDKEGERRKADESSLYSRRMFFRYEINPLELRARVITRDFRRFSGESSAHKLNSIHLSGRSETQAARRTVKIIPKTITLAGDSRDFRGHLNFGRVLVAASSTSEKQSRDSQLINYVLNYLSVSLIPAIKSAATSAAALASMSLPDWNINAIMFSNEFVSTDDGQKSFSAGGLSTDYLTKVTSSFRAMLLPQLFSNERKAMEANIKNVESLAEGKFYWKKINEKGSKVWTPEPNDDSNTIRMLHPKLTKDNNLFSMTIGGCMAALAMSVSTK